VFATIFEANFSQTSLNEKLFADSTSIYKKWLFCIYVCMYVCMYVCNCGQKSLLTHYIIDTLCIDMSATSGHRINSDMHAPAAGPATNGHHHHHDSTDADVAPQSLAGTGDYKDDDKGLSSRDRRGSSLLGSVIGSLNPFGSRKNSASESESAHPGGRAQGNAAGIESPRISDGAGHDPERPPSPEDPMQNPFAAAKNLVASDSMQQQQQQHSADGNQPLTRTHRSLSEHSWTSPVPVVSGTSTATSPEIAAVAVGQHRNVSSWESAPPLVSPSFDVGPAAGGGLLTFFFFFFFFLGSTGFFFFFFDFLTSIIIHMLATSLYQLLIWKQARMSHRVVIQFLHSKQVSLYLLLHQSLGINNNNSNIGIVIMGQLG
jgi:hypothetical protein